MSRDHIIPKFILKGFAINPEVAPKNQAVLIYDVKRKETKRIKIADAYQLENFNSDITEKHLAYNYENDVAKLFQRIKEIAAAEKKRLFLQMMNTNCFFDSSLSCGEETIL